MMSRFVLPAFAAMCCLAFSPSVAVASDSVRAGKGMASLPQTTEVRAAAAVCHPDPVKSRACRHHIAKAREAARTEPAMAHAEAAVAKGSAE